LCSEDEIIVHSACMKNEGLRRSHFSLRYGISPSGRFMNMGGCDFFIYFFLEETKPSLTGAPRTSALILLSKAMVI